MLRQLYPVLLSVTIAVAIGVYLHPAKARKWIQQAGYWGEEVLTDALRLADTLAQTAQAQGSQPGYASTAPASDPGAAAYPATSDSSWAYTETGGQRPTVAPSGTAPSQPPYVATPPLRPGSTTSAHAATAGASDPRARVLASSDGSMPAGDGGQYGNAPYPAYPNTSAETSSTTNHTASPYVNPDQNPLRPNMARTAPWAITPQAPGEATSGVPNLDNQAFTTTQATPNVGAPYPRVRWAGDWRDYQGVPDNVKPLDQPSYGYLPPPNIQSTTDQVNQYLPDRPTAPLPSGQASPPSAAQSTTPTGTATLPSQASPGPNRQRQAAAALAGSATGIQSPTTVAPPADNRAWNQRQSFPAHGSTQPPAYPPRTSFPAASQQTAGPAPGPAAAMPSQPRTPGASSYLPRRSGPSQASQHSVQPTQSFPTSPRMPANAEMQSPDPVADLTLCEGAQILARVGSELVLGSEVYPTVNQKMSEVPDIEKYPQAQIEREREMAVKALLQQQIDMKLLYVDAKRNLPPEALADVGKRLGEAFEESEVPARLKAFKLESRRELEAKLAEWGTSLEREKRAFIELSIAQIWKNEKLGKAEEVTHEALLNYYNEHGTEYDHPARLRWEHLEVRFDRHPNKQEARQLIAAMGNAVIQGRPFAQVARERSEGPMAASGGQRDWLTQGSLKSEVLDKALFSLPPGSLSPILEDETGLHIVRVVERQDAYRTPFEEIQSEIRKKIEAERERERLKEFVTELREEIPVWTIFDKQTARLEEPGQARFQ